MHFIKHIIELIFSAALFINALLMIPQMVCIVRQKSAKDVSLTMFAGCFMIQCIIILHGLIMGDYRLVMGYFFILIATGTVTRLIIIYRRPTSKSLFRLNFKQNPYKNSQTYDAHHQYSKWLHRHG